MPTSTEQPASGRILYVENDLPSFLACRLPQALGARDLGYQVHVATPLAPGLERLAREGLIYHPIPMTRSGWLPWEELYCLLSLVRLYRRVGPSLVHHITIKPVLYGGVAAALTGVRSVVSAITGLGYIYTGEGPFKRLSQAVVTRMLRLLFHRPGQGVIFQNSDDRQAFIEAGVVAEAALIKGSGVDPTEFPVRPEPDGPIQVLFPARMLWDKGLAEFVEAARLIRAAGLPARLVMVGDRDANPAAVPLAVLEAWNQSGLVQWLGHCGDMPRMFAESHIVCLPSYREGVPRALIEAASCGRAIVATDVPGCREIVRHMENGLLVPVREARALFEALKLLIEDADLRRRLGRRGREMVEEEFSVARVVRETLAVYRTLEGRGAHG
jgi:glycosyltransferase involved in cell wall biosynthesis